MEDGWERISDFQTGPIGAKKFRSKRTGLHVVNLDVQGPLVFGFFALATESHCDDGCPHTLEHLVFMGSEKYRYKGVLDELANRNLSQGTNAWTDTDNTVYTLETAGKQGFLNLLPVYLDHILHPTLTDAGYHTEVHHIDGQGKDAGVVYCEMQARENTGESRIERELLRLLWPGKCGYKSETGGILKDIRALKADTVRAYHEQYYRPENLCVIVVGQVPDNELLEAVRPTEEDILAKLQARSGEGSPAPPPFHRPWMSEPPALAETARSTVLYPAQDESSGMVFVGWQTCEWGDFVTRSALEVLWEYLVDGPIATLQKRLVEVEEPLCGRIYEMHTEGKRMAQQLVLESVPAKHLEGIEAVVFEELDKCAREGVDMNRLKTVIELRMRQQRNSREDDPHEFASDAAIGDYLYGAREGPPQDQLQHVLDDLPRLQELSTRPAQFWSDILRKYALDCPHVTVVGRPSQKCGDDLNSAENERLEKQKKKLVAEHPDRLSQLQADLDQAMAANAVRTPKEVLQEFPVPDLAGVKAIPVWTAANSAVNCDDDDDIAPATATTAGRPGEEHSQHSQLASSILLALQALPLSTQVDHVSNSDFVGVTLLLNTDSLPEHLRLYLPLFREVLFECALRRDDGSLEPHDSVVQRLQQETVEFSSMQGRSTRSFSPGSFSQVLMLWLKFAAEDYVGGAAARWSAALLTNTVFTSARVRVAAKRLLGDVPGLKDEGGYIARTAMRRLRFGGEDSNMCATSFLRQQRFLKAVVAKIDAEDDDGVQQNDKKEQQEEGEEVVDSGRRGEACESLDVLRSLLTAPGNVRLHLAMDALAHKEPLAQWSNLDLGQQQGQKRQELEPAAFRYASEFIVSAGADLWVEQQQQQQEEEEEEENDKEQNVQNEHKQQQDPSDAPTKVTAVPMAKSADVVVPLPAVESSYLVLTTVLEGAKKHAYEWSDYCAMKVLLEYLTALEGPLWKRIRGAGLSYSYGARVNMETGLLTFELSKSTNVVAALTEAHTIVKDLVEGGAAAFSAEELEAAKSSLAYAQMSPASTLPGAADEAMVDAMLRRVPTGYAQRLLAGIQTVSADDLARVLPLVMRVFDPAHSLCVVVTNPSHLDNTLKGLQAAPFSRSPPIVQPSLYSLFGMYEREDDDDDDDDGYDDEDDSEEEEDEDE